MDKWLTDNVFVSKTFSKYSPETIVNERSYIPLELLFEGSASYSQYQMESTCVSILNTFSSLSV